MAHVALPHRERKWRGPPQGLRRASWRRLAPTTRPERPHTPGAGLTAEKNGIFSVFPKSLRAQRAGRVAPRRGGAKRRAAALGAAQRRKAPPQAAERRAAHKACFSAFNFPPIIEKQKMLTGTSAGIRPVLQLRRSLGTELHGYTIK